MSLEYGRGHWFGGEPPRIFWRLYGRAITTAVFTFPHMMATLTQRSPDGLRGLTFYKHFGFWLGPFGEILSPRQLVRMLGRLQRTPNLIWQHALPT